MIGSYPTIFALGHKAAAKILDGPVVIEEKVDGSQLSATRIGDVLLMRSKGAVLNIDFSTDPWTCNQSMFNAAVAAFQSLFDLMHEGWVYRGEYLQSPRHNVAKYDRIPTKHVILFDVQIGVEEYLSSEDKANEAARLGLEVVPCVYQGLVPSLEFFQSLLARESTLGGCEVEGVVVKNYAQFGPDKKVLMCKFVSEKFKESHRTSWGESNPGRADVIQLIVNELRCEPRWQKAVQHLREQGLLTESPRDIGALIKEIQQDTKNEEREQIMDRLFSYFWPQISRAIVAGVPEWYKQTLAENAFAEVAR